MTPCVNQLKTKEQWVMLPISNPTEDMDFTYVLPRVCDLASYLFLWLAPSESSLFLRSYFWGPSTSTVEISVNIPITNTHTTLSK